MSKNQGSINFIEAYQHTKKKRKTAKKGARAITVLIALTVLFVGIFVFLQVDIFFQGTELAYYYSTQSELQPQYEHVQQLEQEQAVLQSVSLGLADEQAYTQSFPELGTELFSKLKSCTGDKYIVTLYRYDETTGIIQLEVNTGSVNDMPVLIERLRDTGLFMSVAYTGYTSDSDGIYYCTVGCQLFTASPTE